MLKKQPQNPRRPAPLELIIAITLSLVMAVIIATVYLDRYYQPPEFTPEANRTCPAPAAPQRYPNDIFEIYEPPPRQALPISPQTNALDPNQCALTIEAINPGAP